MSGGNNHAIEHEKLTKHTIVMKIGTLTNDGNADLWCYKCDIPVIVPDLSLLLQRYNISIESAKKFTETTTELAHILHHDTSKINDNEIRNFPSIYIPPGIKYKFIVGPNCTGLINPNNLCYMNSIFQCIFSSNTTELCKKQYIELKDHILTCKVKIPTDCLQCQLFKVTNALCTNIYSKLNILCPNIIDDEIKNEQIVFNGLQYENQLIPSVKEIIKPNQLYLKHLINKSNNEFNSNRQQCAYEYFIYLLNELQKKLNINVQTDYECWQTTKIQCTECNGTYYQHEQIININISLIQSTVSDNTTTNDEIYFKDTLYKYIQERSLDSFDCRNCGKRTKANTSIGLRTYPKYLVIFVSRFGNYDPKSWVPIKLNKKLLFDINTVTDTTVIDFSIISASDPLKDTNLIEDGQKPQPRVNITTTTNNNKSNDSHTRKKRACKSSIEDYEKLQNLAEISGCSLQLVRYAMIINDDNQDRALDWIFSNPDVDISNILFDETIDIVEDDVQSNNDDTTTTTTLVPIPDIETVTDTTAMYRLRSVVVHQGNSISCGHYVTYVYQPEDNTKEYYTIDSNTLQVEKTSKPGWVCYNDNKVFQITNPSEISSGYLYFFERA